MQVATLEGQSGAVNSLCMYQDSSLMLSGSNDGTLQSWDLQQVFADISIQQVAQKQKSKKANFA